MSAAHAQPENGEETASTADTVDSIVAAAVRTETPIRRLFLQQPIEGADDKLPGPLSLFVKSRDRLGLLLYLLAVTKASKAPWDTRLPAAVWARALGLDLPESRTSLSKISKLWRRIEAHQLIDRSRVGRMARIQLLREDGSGDPYTHPAEDENYFKVPAALFTSGPSDQQRWYLTLTLPELAMLLIALSVGDNFTMPAERVPDWYGISADTAGRGFHGLRDHQLLTITQRRKKAPLTAKGYTTENVYILTAPFGPHGVDQRSRRRTST